MSNLTTVSLSSSAVTNMNGSESDGGQPLKEFKLIVLPVIYSVVVFVGLIGNGLVVYIMQFKVPHRNITDVYILNLAIADFIFVSMLPFWTVALAIDWWPFGSAMCKIASGITYFDMYASVFFMTAMAVDRFIAVVLYQSARRTMLRARIIVISIWVFSTILGVIPMYFRGTTLPPESDLPKCSWKFNESVATDKNWFMVYSMTRSLIGFVIPLLIIIVCYSAIIIFLQTRGTTGKLTEKVQDRATKMVLVVVGVFLVCWLPNQISNLIYVIETLSDAESALAHYYVHMFTTTLAYLHSCINPILYAFMRADLRIKVTESYHSMAKCCFRGRKRIPPSDIDMSLSPKTEDRRRIFVDGENQSRFLGLTELDMIPGSCESVAKCDGSNGWTKPSAFSEKDTLLQQPAAEEERSLSNQIVTDECTQNEENDEAGAETTNNDKILKTQDIQELLSQQNSEETVC